MDKPAEWLTLFDAAVASGLSVPTLRRRVRDGSLRAGRVGRAYVVESRDLLEFLRARDASIRRTPRPRH